VLEPVEENRRLLERNIARNNLRGVTIAPYGIYTVTGTVQFDTHDKPLDAGHIVERQQEPLSGSGYFSIFVMTMKLDIEGAEFALVEQRVGDLSATVMRIIMEYHPWVKEGARDFLVKTLTERGDFDLIYETKNVLGFSNRHLE
jgi:hypothetical protein